MKATQKCGDLMTSPQFSHRIFDDLSAALKKVKKKTRKYNMSFGKYSSKGDNYSGDAGGIFYPSL